MCEKRPSVICVKYCCYCSELVPIMSRVMMLCDVIVYLMASNWLGIVNRDDAAGYVGLPTLNWGIPGLSPLPSPPAFPLPSLLPFPGAHPLNQIGGLGSAVSSPSGVYVEAPADKLFGAYLSHKKIEVALLCFCNATAIRLIGNCK